MGDGDEAFRTCGIVAEAAEVTGWRNASMEELEEIGQITATIIIAKCSLR